MKRRLQEIILSSACGLLVGNVHAQQPDPTLPMASEHAILTLHGVGSQIYSCQPIGNNGQYQWTFLAPAARLFNSAGNEVATHGDGPTWTYQDSSSIQGVVQARSPSPDAASIPWLLLKATNPQRSGILTTVDTIRRSDTQGGVAPAAGCDAAHQGALARIPYTATYTFYSAKP